MAIGASQDADTSIGIQLDFDLSAGDSVSWLGFFEVLPVPGAGGLPLLLAMSSCAGGVDDAEAERISSSRT